MSRANVGRVSLNLLMFVKSFKIFRLYLAGAYSSFCWRRLWPSEKRKKSPAGSDDRKCIHKRKSGIRTVNLHQCKWKENQAQSHLCLCTQAAPLNPDSLFSPTHKQQFQNLLSNNDSPSNGAEKPSELRCLMVDSLICCSQWNSTP